MRCLNCERDCRAHLDCCAASPAQQPLTWDQVKAKFELSNPALKADADNVDEMKAEEITAFLRPNPQFTIAADGTQIAPHDGVWTPFKGTMNSPTSVTCTSAITSANCAWRALRKARASRNRSTRICSETWCLRCARHLWERSRPSTFSIWPRPTSITTTRSSTSAAHRFKAGDLAQIDLDRIELLRVQYESEIETAIVNLRTAKIQLLQMLNDRTPVDQFDVTGTVRFQRYLAAIGDLSRCRFGGPARPAGRAADDSAIRDQSQAGDCERLDRSDLLPPGSRITPRPITPMAMQTLGVSVSIPLRIFDRNQGEKKRTPIDIDRSQQASEATRAQVFSDVDTAYELVRSNIALLKPYKEKYNDQALRVRDTVTFAYEHGGASLMDFLNAQSDYRQVQLAYAQLIGAYLTAAGQLNLAVGSEVIK